MSTWQQWAMKFHHISLWQHTECQRNIGQVSLNNNIKHQTSTITKRGIYLQTQAWSESSGLSEVFGRTPFQSPQNFRSSTIFASTCLPVFLRTSRRHCGLERRPFQGLVGRCWWSRRFSNAPSWSAIPRPWTPCLGPWTLLRPCLGP